jgi:maltose alpha-D-glucosyltransferase/alpha-amylase
MTRAAATDLWWKNAIIYCLDIETFLDWDGDGVGDVDGLVERVDYLAGIGVTCIWLLPFQPTPNRDDGYDITDYYAIDPRFGSLGDFVVFLNTARDRGIRVIMDLVVNHTSDQHPWFKSARRSRTSPYRDWYVWRDTPPKTKKSDIVFPDAETSLWEHDERTDQWYLHHFYKHQPDLNIANPAVREEIKRIVGFWLELGVDGFRMDAVPFLVESDESAYERHQLFKELRAFITRRRGDAMLLGEVNLKPKQMAEYFGDEPGDELQMLFCFPVMEAMYLTLARRDSRPIARALRSLPKVPMEGQWAHFVRNHDELTLDKLTDKQRDEVFAAFGPDPDMQLFGRGLRRRLPSMLDGDERRIRLVYSLLLTLPGTPVLFYGEEIGMAENLDIPGRLSVRTPMQWTDQRNGGFSPVAPSRVVRPVPDGRFGPMAVNVLKQRRDHDSLLNWFERLIRRRRETGELGMGELEILDAGDDAVLAHRVSSERVSIIAVHNFSDEPRTVRLSLGDLTGFELTDLLEHDSDRGLKGNVLELQLEGYAYRWLRLQPDDVRTAP